MWLGKKKNHSWQIVESENEQHLSEATMKTNKHIHIRTPGFSVDVD